MAVDCGSQKTEKININIDIGGRGLGAFAINDYNSKCLLTFVQDCSLTLEGDYPNFECESPETSKQSKTFPAGCRQKYNF